MAKNKKPNLIYQIIKKRDKILKIAEKHGVENVRVFGSVSRKQEKQQSDIDLLVDVAKKPDGTRGNYIAFALEVGELFQTRPVEVCTPETLHPRFRDKVLANCVSIMIENPDDIDNTKVDERDVVVNIEKAKDGIKDFWRIIKASGREKFLTDRDVQLMSRSAMQIAVEELVRRVPRDIKKQIRDVRWGNLKKFRNFLVHNYDNVEWETMWEMSQEKMKEVEHACDRVLEVLEGKE